MKTANSSRFQIRTLKSVVTCLSLLGVVLVAPAALAQWPQWGGLNRDFKSSAKGLSKRWAKDGPKRLWSRALGEGYSTILVDQGRLYTMYRNGENEVVVALEADTGKTVWEYKYAAPVLKGIEKRFGIGPNSTPIIVDGRVYALGFGAHLHCLDKLTGKLIWSHNLVKDLGAKPPEFGFSSSPVAHGNLLIAAVGGKGCGMMAFDLVSGSVVWKKHDFINIYSSPIVINVDGEDQVVLLTDREIVGIDPVRGELKWRHPHENQWKTNICTPLWSKEQMLFISSSGDAGSRSLKLTRVDGKTKVEEIWATRKMRTSQGNVVRIGKYLYGSTGDKSVSYMVAVHASTGKVAWRKRGFPEANLIYANGMLVMLDWDGKLSLAKATPKSFKVRSKVELLKKPAWTAPTLVGKTLYLRDKETIMALDMG